MGRVLIDLTDLELWHGNYGGIQRVVYGIAKNFYVNQDEHQVVFMSFKEKDGSFHKTSFDKIYRRVNNQTLKFRPRRLEYSKRKVRFRKSDTVLILGKPWDNTNIQKTLTEKRREVKFKLVQVVYDLIVSLYPNLQNPDIAADFNSHMTDAITNSDLLLAISDNTANDIMKFCHINDIQQPLTRVVRLGDDIDETYGVVKPEKPSNKIAEKFIACIGTIEIRKNHTLLYYTYKLAQELGIDLPQLLVIGSRGWLTGDIQYMIENDPDIRDKILILDKVQDPELVWIYENCIFTVYPSMYEGWGLPVAESLGHGKYCLASGSSSITEIAGDLIDYFSPYNPKECLDMIVKYSDTKAIKEKEQKIKKDYKTTSWENTYQQVRSYIDTI